MKMVFENGENNVKNRHFGQQQTRPERERELTTAEPEDFVGLIGGLTNYIQNQRVASYNEGVDDMLRSVRGWMAMHEIDHNERALPEMLDTIAHHFKACGER
jgi:hypothetical protein